MNPRTRARSWALQVLYAWEQGAAETIRQAHANTRARRFVAPRYREYLETLLGWLEADADVIDGHLRQHLVNWSLERLAATDRNVLRIGVAELLHAHDVPPTVVIHEAMKLAQMYGTPESGRFVNGVLDAVATSVRGSADA